MNAPTPLSTATKPKRVITEARKIQNREAQRAYRQRQRERLKAQKEASVKRSPNGYQEIRPSPVVRVLSRADMRECDQGYGVGSGELGPVDLSGWNANVASPSVTAMGAPSTLTSSTPSAQAQVSEHDSPSEIEDIDSRDVMRDLDVIFPVSAATYHDYGSGFATVDELLGTSSTDSTPITSGTNSTRASTLSPASGEPFPSPHTNRLTEHRTNLLTACMHNASSLGISIDEFFTYNCMSLCSPFYRPTTPSTDPKALLASVISANPFIPTCLRPTLPQILIPHHPVFDLIPMPGLRTRAIVLSAAGTNLVNIFELKRDIIEGGLLCWGVDDCELDRRRKGGGQPWDLRSWEVAPWFKAKWRLLLSGEGADLWG
ncbi:hypothetical protein BDW71DRAFT_190129 [Aspergillus fruticulosus]